MSPQTMPSETEVRPNRMEDPQALEADARLREDIRLLGRILGDTVRDQEGADVCKFFAEALVSPVLTAHPTEVRRKSTIDREMEIAALLDRRERVQLTPEELAASDEQLRREVLTVWQTNLLRRTKLTVLDEVTNGLSFYDYTFLHEVPRLHCVLEDRLNEGDPITGGELASFLRMGSWIGGDRDGNPFVTADVMRGTLRMQSSRVLRYYLEELHVLGSELSLAAHLADVSEDLR